MKKTFKRLLFAIMVVSVLVALAVCVSAESLETTSAKYTLDLTEGVLTVTAKGNTTTLNGRLYEDASIKPEINNITSIKLVGFTAIEVGSSDGPFSNNNKTNSKYLSWPEVTEIDLGSVTTVNQNGNRSLMSGLPKLTTVYANGNKPEDADTNPIVDLSCIFMIYQSSGSHGPFPSLLADCASVKKVKLPDTSVNLFGFRAFYGCTALTEITFPIGYTNINGNNGTAENTMFGGCTSLTKITFEAETLTVSNLTIPTSVEEIVCYNDDVKTALGYAGIANGSVMDRPITTVTSGSVDTPISGTGTYTWTLNSIGVLEITDTSDKKDSTIGPELTDSIAKINSELGYSSGPVGQSGGESYLQTKVTKIKLIGFKTVYIGAGANGGGNNSAFSNVNGYGFPNLVELDLGTVTVVKGATNNDRGLLQNLTKITTVYSGEENYRENVVNLSAISSISGGFGRMLYACSSVTNVILPNCIPGTVHANLLYNATSLESITFPVGWDTLNVQIFDTCESLETVTFESYTLTIANVTFPTTVTSWTCYSEGVKNALEAYNVSTEKITVKTRSCEYIGTLSNNKNTTVSYRWTLNDDGTLEVTNLSGGIIGFELYESVNESNILYPAKVTKIVLDNFHTLWNDDFNSAFSYVNSAGFANLTEIDLGSVTTHGLRTNSGGRGIFQGSSKLTTVYSDKDNRVEGVVNLSCITTLQGSSKYGQLGRMFSGCSSMTNVILPNVTVDSFGPEAFKNCSSLQSVTFPVGYTNITATDMFAGCTSLKTVIFEASSLTVTGSLALPTDSTKVYCHKDAVKTALINAGLESDKITNFGGAMDAYGFMVRTNKTSTSVNGLRTLYSFNKDTCASVATTTGLTFKEFGALVASKNNLGDSKLGLIKTANGYIVNTPGAVRFTIFEGDVQKNMILADQDGNEATVEFAVTLTNFTEAYFASDVYACGYVIYVDAEGNEYIEYSNYGDKEGKSDWKYVSLYDMVVYMAEQNWLSGNSNEGITKATDKSCTWDILVAASGQTAQTTENTVSIVIDGKLYYYCIDGERAEDTDETEAINGQTYTEAYAIWVKETE